MKQLIAFHEETRWRGELTLFSARWNCYRLPGLPEDHVKKIVQKKIVIPISTEYISNSSCGQIAA